MWSKSEPIGPPPLSNVTLPQVFWATPGPPGPVGFPICCSTVTPRPGHQDRPDVLSGSTTDDENLDSEDAASADAEGSVSDAEGQEQGDLAKWIGARW